MATMLEDIGHVQTAACMRDNRDDLKSCRTLLIETMKSDLGVSTAEQLEAQAQMVEGVGGPKVVVDCLRELAKARGDVLV